MLTTTLQKGGTNFSTLSMWRILTLFKKKKKNLDWKHHSSTSLVIQWKIRAITWLSNGQSEFVLPELPVCIPYSLFYWLCIADFKSTLHIKEIQNNLSVTRVVDIFSQFVICLWILLSAPSILNFLKCGKLVFSVTISLLEALGPFLSHIHTKVHRFFPLAPSRSRFYFSLSKSSVINGNICYKEWL